MKVAGIYLAAGESRRMGRPKLSLELSPERTVGGSALQELSKCGFDPLVIVVRADDPLSWLPQVAEDGQAWRTESCFTAHLGLSFSLRCGMNAVLPSEPDVLLIALADQPLISAEPIERMISAFRDNPELDYAASSNQGVGMPPVMFSKGMFPVLEGLIGDQGARRILDSGEYRGVMIDPDSENYFTDVDTEKDYERISAIFNGSRT